MSVQAAPVVMDIGRMNARGTNNGKNVQHIPLTKQSRAARTWRMVISIAEFLCAVKFFALFLILVKALQQSTNIYTFLFSARRRKHNARFVRLRHNSPFAKKFQACFKTAQPLREFAVPPSCVTMFSAQISASRMEKRNYVNHSPPFNYLSKPASYTRFSLVTPSRYATLNLSLLFIFLLVIRMNTLCSIEALDPD